MARIRSFRPTIWTDPRFVALSRGARFTLLGIAGRFLDDHGRGSRNTREILSNLYPTDDSVTQADVEREMAEILESGILVAYVSNGQSLIECPEWRDSGSAWFQQISHPSRSLYPSRNPRETLANDSGDSHTQIGEREERRESEGNALLKSVPPLPGEMGTELPPPPARAAGDAHLTAAGTVDRDRRRRAAKWANENPAELAKLESVVDREIARYAPGPTRDEIRRGMLVGKILQCAEGGTPAREAVPA